MTVGEGRGSGLCACICVVVIVAVVEFTTSVTIRQPLFINYRLFVYLFCAKIYVLWDNSRPLSHCTCNGSHQVARCRPYLFLWMCYCDVTIHLGVFTIFFPYLGLGRTSNGFQYAAHCWSGIRPPCKMIQFGAW